MAEEKKKTDSALYDRQLRLWGEEGQARLESAKICLINANATGTETLKNLVLPGVGSFTIVDGNKVEDADLGNNFFVDASTIGKSRAQVARDLLNELNDLVTGEAVEKDPVALINENPTFFTQFTLVIASNLAEEPLLKLAKVCFEHQVAVFSIRSYGLIGYVRLVIPEHTIVESRPDNPPDDLRLTNPFPELSKYAESINLDNMDSTQHSHTAYVILLLKYFSSWKASHDGRLPSSYAEKNEFRNLVIRGAKKPDEENFNEAYKNALKACAPYRIPSNTQDILNDPKAVTLNANSSKFWILAHALKGFVENEGAGLLPLPGNLSDMTATTEGYIALQTLYQTKAAEDVSAVTARVKESLSKLGKPENFITADEIKTFCKNSNFLNCIRYRTLEDERKPATAKSSLFATQLASAAEESSFNIVWYFMLRAADRFYTEHKRYPGSDDAHVKNDAVLLKTVVDKMLAELSITVPIDTKYVEEIVRFGASELHPIASFIGGVASEEVIKAITHMYTPMNNTFVFNGLNSTSLTIAV